MTMNHQQTNTSKRFQLEIAMKVISFFKTKNLQKTILKAFIFSGLILGLSSCDSIQADKTNTVSAKKASAKLNPTQGNHAQGDIVFTVVDNGVLIVGDIIGLTPGEHGFHILENGDCSAPDGSSGGDHFNPSKNKHGSPEQPNRHVGDLGNIVADNQGNVHFERIDKVISLEGENSIIGRSVIVHEKKDDFVTQPTGDAGKRLACGRIEIIE